VRPATLACGVRTTRTVHGSVQPGCRAPRVRRLPDRLLARADADPILAYSAGAEVSQLQWSTTQPDWVAICFANKTQARSFATLLFDRTRCACLLTSRRFDAAAACAQILRV